MAGSVKPANVSVYTKLTSVVATSGVQFGFGQSKVSSNCSEVVPIAVCAGTISLPFFVEVITDVVSVVSDSVNGSTRCPPGFVHVPVNVEVTAKFTVAFVFPTPSSAVPVQVTVSPLRVHTGAASPCAKCAPCGALSRLTVVTASAGTAAKAVTSSESTAIMPIFLISVFLLLLIGFYSPLNIDAITASRKVVECLFAGAGCACEAVCIAYIKRPAPCSFRFLRKLIWPYHHLLLLVRSLPIANQPRDLRFS